MARLETPIITAKIPQFPFNEDKINIRSAPLYNRGSGLSRAEAKALQIKTSITMDSGALQVKKYKRERMVSINQSTPNDLRILVSAGSALFLILYLGFFGRTPKVKTAESS